MGKKSSELRPKTSNGRVKQSNPINSVQGHKNPMTESRAFRSNAISDRVKLPDYRKTFTASIQNQMIVNISLLKPKLAWKSKTMKT